jgi:hypothetical protein
MSESGRMRPFGDVGLNVRFCRERTWLVIETMKCALSPLKKSGPRHFVRQISGVRGRPPGSLKISAADA